MDKLLHVGLDVGSTTVKIVVLDDSLNELYVNYVTSTGYVARTKQNNQYIGFRPIIKVRKK